MKRALTFLSVVVLVATMLAFGPGCSNTKGEATFSADLKGADETPPVATPATGHLDITFNADRTKATFKLTVSGGVGVISAELHSGAVNVSGLRVAILFDQPAGRDVNGTLAEGTLTQTSFLGDLTSLAALESAITQGNVYCNVHTLANPNGAIRGQLR